MSLNDKKKTPGSAAGKVTSWQVHEAWWSLNGWATTVGPITTWLPRTIITVCVYHYRWDAWQRHALDTATDTETRASKNGTWQVSCPANLIITKEIPDLLTERPKQSPEASRKYARTSRHGFRDDTMTRYHYGLGRLEVFRRMIGQSSVDGDGTDSTRPSMNAIAMYINKRTRSCYLTSIAMCDRPACVITSITQFQVTPRCCCCGRLSNVDIADTRYIYIYIYIHHPYPAGEDQARANEAGVELTHRVHCVRCKLGLIGSSSLVDTAESGQARRFDNE